MIVGNNILVTLTGVPDRSRASVSVSGINGTGTAAVSLGFLVGDVNSTRSVNSSDVSAIKRRIGQTTNGSNFRLDVNGSGSVTNADLTAARSRAGTSLP